MKENFYRISGRGEKPDTPKPNISTWEEEFEDKIGFDIPYEKGMVNLFNLIGDYNEFTLGDLIYKYLNIKEKGKIKIKCKKGKILIERMED